MTNKILSSAMVIIIPLLISNIDCCADSLSPTEILKKTELVYRKITTYSDSGSVQSKAGKIEFQSKFKRPNLYVLKWTSILPRVPDKEEQYPNSFSLLLSCKSGVFTYFNYSENPVGVEEEYASIEKAIYASTGRSWATSITIPAFFFPSIDTIQITDIVDVGFVEDDIDKMSPYYIISGRKNVGQNYRLWIEKKTYLIRKIIIDNLIYFYFDDIEIDVEIPDEMFQRPN